LGSAARVGRSIFEQPNDGKKICKDQSQKGLDEIFALRLAVQMLNISLGKVNLKSGLKNQPHN
jgi:hypothetical protein